MRCPFRYVLLIFLCFSCSPSKNNDEHSSYGGSFNFNNLYHIHKRLGDPLPGDWREAHPEISQPVDSYVKKYVPIRDRELNLIYFLPIGHFTDDQLEVLRLTRDYVTVFYGIETKLLDAIDDRIIPDSVRRMHLDTEQLFTKYILYDILKPKIPEDGFAMFAITEKDLYPGDEWNFVFGQASLRDKVGVASLYRLNNEYEKQLFARRIMKTVAHELGHIAHIKHCQKFACMMNGSNSLTEADKRPLWLCPACMYKLTWFLGYDAEERLKNLRGFYSKIGFVQEAKFIQKSLEYSLD